MARIQTSQANLRGPVVRDENLIAHPWYVALVIGFSIAGVAVLLWAFQAGVWWATPAVSNELPPAQTAANSPQPVAVPPAAIQQDLPPAVYASVPSVSAEPAELTPEELDRRHTEYLRRRDQ